MDTGGRERLRTRRDALVAQLESLDWRHAERLGPRDDDNEREPGQRWSKEDREKCQAKGATLPAWRLAMTAVDQSRSPTYAGGAAARSCSTATTRRPAAREAATRPTTPRHGVPDGAPARRRVDGAIARAEHAHPPPVLQLHLQDRSLTQIFTKSNSDSPDWTRPATASAPCSTDSRTERETKARHDRTSTEPTSSSSS